MSILHSHESHEWGTPKELFVIIHNTLGEIELDVASTETANEWIQASRYYTCDIPFQLELEDTKRRLVFCNPPGEVKGDPDSRGNARYFITTCANKIVERHWETLVLVCFKLEHLKYLPDNVRGKVIIPKARLKFLKLEDVGCKSQPTHQGAIVVLYQKLTPKILQFIYQLHEAEAFKGPTFTLTGENC